MCDHCKGVLGNKVEAWSLMRPTDDHEGIGIDGRSASDIFDALGVKRACCRLKLMSYNAKITEHNQYARTNIHNRK
jgi:DNA-directed RNA polymerase subunit N (RpoN/RPB10)